MLEKMITQYRQWVFRKCLKFKILCNKLQQALVNVLLRFRIYQVALLCDVYSIGEQPQDRPYKRKLSRSLNQSEKPKILQFTCVVFGINSSPFHAQYVSQHNAKKNTSDYSL